MENVLATLKKRLSFLETAKKGKRFFCEAFVCQYTPYGSQQFGFTASRKLGNAVARNKAKRRLKEAVREVLRQRKVKVIEASYGTYVLIAKPAVLSIKFSTLLTDVNKMLTHKAFKF